jgi:hypothetical protein
MKPSIELHIEELVLHGFNPADRHRIAAALEGELGRLFTERGVPPGLLTAGERPHVNAGAFDAVQGARAEITGTGLAGAVYAGLGK